jgi:hypothetical protein
VTVGHNPPVPASPRCCIWLSGPGLQDLDIWLSAPGFQDLDKRAPGFTIRTWVSGPRKLCAGFHSQDLGFRTSKALYGFHSQDLGFRTSKALHPTAVLSFSRHFSLRPPLLFSASSGHRRTQQVPVLESRFPNPTVRAGSAGGLKRGHETVRAGSAGELKRGTVVSDRRTHGRT